MLLPAVAPTLSGGRSVVPAETRIEFRTQQPPVRQPAHEPVPTEARLLMSRLNAKYSVPAVRSTGAVDGTAIARTIRPCAGSIAGGKGQPEGGVVVWIPPAIAPVPVPCAQSTQYSAAAGTVKSAVSAAGTPRH